MDELLSWSFSCRTRLIRIDSKQNGHIFSIALCQHYASLMRLGFSSFLASSISLRSSKLHGISLALIESLRRKRCALTNELWNHTFFILCSSQSLYNANTTLSERVDFCQCCVQGLLLPHCMTGLTSERLQPFLSITYLYPRPSPKLLLFLLQTYLYTYFLVYFLGIEAHMVQFALELTV